jgi:squalene-hopene/tetraprenyl-beta-curcumene cyclase
VQLSEMWFNAGLSKGAVFAGLVECGGWAFERANTLYPDVDDTAVAMIVLAQLRTVVPSAARQRIEAALRHAEIWVRAMQSSNGGWGAFDKDNNRCVGSPATASASG